MTLSAATVAVLQNSKNNKIRFEFQSGFLYAKKEKIQQKMLNFFKLPIDNFKSTVYNNKAVEHGEMSEWSKVLAWNAGVR